MEKKEKILFFFLLFLLFTLPLALFSLKMPQELRTRAAGCTASYDTNFLANDKWQLIGNKYQILSSTNNSFKINWSCDTKIASFKVKNESGDITTKCKTDKLKNPQCPSTGCIPAGVPNAKSGTVTCENLTTGLFNVYLLLKKQ